MVSNPQSLHCLYHIRDPELTNGFGYDGYIGITDNFLRRKKQHFVALNNGEHANGNLQGAHDNSVNGLQIYWVASGTKKEMEAHERLLVPKPNHHWNKQTGGGPRRGMSKDEALNAIAPPLTSTAEDKGQGDTPKVGAAKSDSKGKAVFGIPALEFVTDIGATTGIGVVLAASGLGTAYVLNRTLLKDDIALEIPERDARAAGRKGAYAGGGLGAAGTMAVIFGAGEVVGLGAVGVGSGLTAIGGAVGGAGVAGLCIAVAAPAAIAAVTAGAVYGVYKLVKWFGS